MGCFDNIIAIKELCEEITPQTFYLNDIGINKTEVEQIITSEYESVQDFIDQKSAFAIRQVQGDVYSHLLPSFKADSILAAARIGHEATTKELVTQSGYVGIEIRMNNPVSFVDFTVSDVSVFTDFTGNIPLLVYDLFQGKLLGTLTVASTAGVISQSYETITVSAPRKELHLWIGYNAAAINSYKTSANSGCSTCTGYTFTNRFIRASGASASAPFTEATIDPLTHTGGISFNYSVACNHYDWLCNHRKVMGLPILYQTGLQIMNHGLLSAINQRTMTITTVTKDVLKEKQNFYAEQYNATLTNILNNMRVPSDVNCFHCNKTIRSVTALP